MTTSRHGLVPGTWTTGARMENDGQAAPNQHFYSSKPGSRSSTRSTSLVAKETSADIKVKSPIRPCVVVDLHNGRFDLGSFRHVQDNSDTDRL